MKKITLILLCVISMFANAQSLNTDSLENVLNTQELTDDERLTIYKKLCNWYRDYDTEKLGIYARKILGFSIKNKDDYAIASSYYFIGISHHSKASLDSALIYYQKTLDVALEANDKQSESSAYTSMGILYSDKGDLVKSLDYFLKALSLAETLQNTQQQLRILGNIGTLYRRLDNDKHALEYFERIKTMAEKEDIPDGKCIAYFNLASIYQNNDEIDKGLEYSLKTLDISRSIGFRQYEIASLLNIAHVYYSEKYADYKRAEKYATEGLKVAEEYGDPQLLRQAYAILSDIYLRQKRYEECDKTALKAWETDTTDIVSGRTNIVNIILSNIYLGNKDKAVRYFDTFYFAAQKMNEKSIHEALADMEVKYETEKKEMRISTLEKDRKLYISLSVAIVFILLLIIGLLYYRHRLVIQKRRMADQEIKQLKQEKELVATRAALDAEKAEREIIARDLHDGVGAMLSVVKNNMDITKSYLMIENKEAEHFNRALDGLDQSITELRRVAHHIMPAILIEKGLPLALEEFCCSIPESEFHCTELEHRFEPEKELVLYRCAYELVSNALRHSGASLINVHLTIDEKTVYLSVVDDGCGFDLQTASMGMGINNMRTRLTAFGGRIDIYSEPGKGTEVNVELNVANGE